MNLILLGAPGAGKGTQATKIAERYGLVHISTGDIFRANIKNGTEIGLLAKSYTDKGELVPDEVTVAIVKDRLTWADCANGYLLDGFPRNLFIDHKLLMDRLCGRRVCRECGESYHVSSLNGSLTCARCGGELYQRKDDNPETVGARLAVYNEQTAPLIDYYTKKGIILNVTGTEAPAEVLFEAVKKVLDPLAK